LLQTVAGILDEGLDPQSAVSRPRLHPVAGLVHLEPGFEPEVRAGLEQAGYEVRAWPSLHHFFGGVSVVGRAGSAGDPRRSGAALALAPG
jgi:gamma-glutamyltranspeptidase/glutathione hydrolase